MAAILSVFVGAFSESWQFCVGRDVVFKKKKKLALLHVLQWQCRLELVLEIVRIVK